MPRHCSDTRVVLPSLGDSPSGKFAEFEKLPTLPPAHPDRSQVVSLVAWAHRRLSHRCTEAPLSTMYILSLGVNRKPFLGCLCVNDTTCAVDDVHPVFGMNRKSLCSSSLCGNITSGEVCVVDSTTIFSNVAGVLCGASTPCDWPTPPDLQSTSSIFDPTVVRADFCHSYLLAAM